MKIVIIIYLIFVLMTSLNCSFQTKLFTKINKEKTGENLIISPLSIFQALSLAANGAKEETLSEMLDLLEASSIDDLNEINYKILSQFTRFKTIDIANAVMTKFTPLKEFTDIAEKYSAPVEPLVSLEQVNNWCSNKTHGKIEKILEFLDPSTLMIILNAVYFKGEWVSQFEEKFTKDLPFYNLGTEETNVKTMIQFEYFKYYEDKKVQAIELRFLEDMMTGIIILPAEGTDINKYINTLSTSDEELNNIIKNLKDAQVHLQLPKFEVRFFKDITEILKDLGMYNAFTGKADFTGLRKESINIDSVIHKTYLKVNEFGTEAAAVTAITFFGSSLPGGEEKIYDMKVNRPFLFLLKNYMLPAGYDLVFMAKIETIKNDE